MKKRKPKTMEAREASRTDNHDLEIQNTSQMSLEPQPQEGFVSLEKLASAGGVTMLPIMSGELFQQAVCYPIIVHGWDKRKCGRVARSWTRTFTQAERNKISRYYAKFYRWYLISGTPKHVACSAATFELLRKAVHFFACI